MIAARHPRLLALLRGVGVLALAAFALAAGWFLFWTSYDPRVDVPPPREIDLAGDGGGRASVLFLGDFAPTDAALSFIEEHGWGYPYSATRGLLAEHDAVIANLEAPVTESDEPFPVPKRWVYKVHPDALVAIREAGIDAVTLANNHAYDYGRRGLADTLRHLDAAGLAHLGAALSEAEARRGLVVRTDGGRLGVLSTMQNRFHWRMYMMAFALDTPFRTWPGVARLGYADLAEDIARLERVADAVVVAVHWGENYTPIRADQERLARACVDLGADVVVGHHPHWAQPVALVDGRPVIYSLGNYAFGTIGNRRMRFGMGAALHLEAGSVRAVELIPLLTQNRIVDYRTRLPRGRRLDRFFRELVGPSAERGAEIERRGNRGWLRVPASADEPAHRGLN